MSSFFVPRDIVATYGTPRSVVPIKRAAYYLRAVARRYELTPLQLRSRERTRFLDAARREYYYLCYIDTLVPTTLGASLLCRSHTTLIKVAMRYRDALSSHEPTTSARDRSN